MKRLVRELDGKMEILTEIDEAKEGNRISAGAGTNGREIHTQGTG